MLFGGVRVLYIAFKEWFAHCRCIVIFFSLRFERFFFLTKDEQKVEHKTIFKTQVKYQVCGVKCLERLHSKLAYCNWFSRELLQDIEYGISYNKIKNSRPYSKSNLELVLYSFIYQVTSTRRQRSDLFGLRVKLPLVTSSLTSQR